MDIGNLIEALPRDIVNLTKNSDVDYINTLGQRIGVLQEYIDEEILANLNTLTETNTKDLVKYSNAVCFNILKHSKYGITKAWGTIFGHSNAESNAYSYSRQKIVSKIAENMDESIRTKFTGVKYKAIERMIDLMDGKAQPSVIPLFTTEDGIQTPLYTDTGERAYKEVYMTVTPKIQLEASAKLIDVLQKQDAIEIDISVTNEYDLLAGKLDSIAEKQHKLLSDGADIVDVQVIGDLLKVKEEDDS